MPTEITELGENFDAGKTADGLVNAGFEMVQVFAKCLFGNSYYFTDVGVRHPALKTDMLREMSEALVARGVTVTAYYSLIPDAVQAKLHPEWKIHYDKKHDLGFAHVDDCASMCLHSPYIDTIVLPQVSEIAKNYPVSGVFFDFGRSACYCGCQCCQKIFKAETGLPLPDNDETDPNWGTYILWKREEQTIFEQKMDRLCKSLDKDFSFVINYSYTIRNPEQGTRLNDFITMDVSESQEPCGLNVSFNAKYLATVNERYEIMTTRMIKWWSSWGLKPYNTLLYQNAIIQTHGGDSIMGDRWDLDWKTDDAILKYFADMNKFVSGIRTFIGNAEPQAKAAIMNCRDFLRNKNSTPANDITLLLAGMEATHKILIQNHLPCLIVDEDNIARYLNDLEVLIIPEQQIDDPLLIEQIRVFVENGGLLVGSLDAGYSEAMAGLFGVKCGDEFSRGFISIATEFIDGKYKFPEIPLDARFNRFKRSGCREIAQTYKSKYSTSSNFGFGPIDRKEIMPGITVKQHGAGHAVYIGAEIFGNYRKTNNPQIKHFIKMLIMKYKPEMIISHDAPDSVELAISTAPAVTFLHCFNYSPEKELAFGCSYIDNSAKISEFQVKIPYTGTIKRIEVFPENAVVPEYKQETGKVILQIKDLKVFRSIAIYE